jgi:hypothetical protein
MLYKTDSDVSMAYTSIMQIQWFAKYYIKAKANQCHNTPMEAQGERRYCSYSFSTSVLDGVSGQRQAPAALYPLGKDPRYPLYRWLGGPRAGLDTEVKRKNPLPLSGIKPRSPGPSVRFQTLYWLSYPAPEILYKTDASVIFVKKNTAVVNGVPFEKQPPEKITCQGTKSKSEAGPPLCNRLSEPLCDTQDKVTFIARPLVVLVAQ